VKKERREGEGRREWNLPHHEILDPPLADWHDLYGGTVVQPSDVSLPPIICTKPSPRDKAIGADTVLKLGGFAPENFFFSVPPKFALCPPIPGAQRGHTAVEKPTL